MINTLGRGSTLLHSWMTKLVTVNYFLNLKVLGVIDLNLKLIKHFC